MQEITQSMLDRVIKNYRNYFNWFENLTPYGPQAIARDATSNIESTDRELGEAIRDKLERMGYIKFIKMAPPVHKPGERSKGHDPEKDIPANLLPYFGPGPEWMEK